MMSENRPKITALIPCFNEESNIRECLESVRWTDEILVVDSFSTDRTREIAAEFTDRILQHEYINSAAQKNWAIPQATHPWVLIVDSDERVTPQLREEILTLLGNGPAHAGYYIGRLNHFMDHPITHVWKTDKCLRLFQRDKGRYQEREVHADIILDGSIGMLESKFLHYTFRSFEQYMTKFDRYTTWAAGDRSKNTRRVGAAQLLLHPVWRFFKQYILKRGFLDGRAGLIICMLSSFSAFLKYAKLWERQESARLREVESRKAR